MKETIIEALEKWAMVQPDKLAWQFHNDKLEIEDTITFKVCNPIWCAILCCITLIKFIHVCWFRNWRILLLLFRRIYWTTVA